VVYWWIGASAVEVPPSPNNQVHDVGLLVEVSMNCTTNGADPLVIFAVNEATGVVAPAGAIRNTSETARIIRNHRVLRFMVSSGY
jgi:hypothetical protein